MDCSIMTKLIETIIQVRYRDPQMKKNFQKLIESMPKQVMQMLKSKSGHIRN